MKQAPAARGYVLLIVLAAVAVLSVVAAFVHSETENQLVLTAALKGQSIAASRATLAAESYLAQYKANYPATTISLLPSFDSYADAVDGGAGATLPDALTDYSPTLGNPALNLELKTGGGVQYCVDVWRLNRGTNVSPWTVLEVFGYYGFRSDATLTSCLGVANSGTVLVSQLEVQIEEATTGGGSGAACPACGSGSAGGF